MRQATGQCMVHGHWLLDASDVREVDQTTHQMLIHTWHVSGPYCRTYQTHTRAHTHTHECVGPTESHIRCGRVRLSHTSGAAGSY